MTTVYRIQVGPHGWVQHFYDDFPQVTGIEASAHQWTDRAEAQACATRWNRRRGYVPGKVVAGPDTEPYVHGDPGTATSTAVSPETNERT